MTVGGPGTLARTVLPLQRELDLESSGGSENRCFFGVFFRFGKKGSEKVLLRFLLLSGHQMEVTGFQHGSQFAPKKVPSKTEWSPEGILGWHLVLFWGPEGDSGVAFDIILVNFGDNFRIF